MSSGYYLICLDCNRAVLLSKPIGIRYPGQDDMTFGFSSLTSPDSDQWQPSAEGCAELQHFMMLHRTHELRVLSEHVNKHVRGDVPGGFPSSADDPDPDYNSKVFFGTVVDPPAPETEADDLPPDLIKRLQQL